MSSSPYHAAGKLATEILEKKKSIKSVAFKKSKLVCTKATYAQVCNTIQSKHNIDKILNHDSGRLRRAIEIEKARHKGLAYVLLSELLFGKYGSIRGGGHLKRKIMKYEKELKEVKRKVVAMEGRMSTVGNTPIFPRYVRVNKLKAITEDVLSELQKELKKFSATMKVESGMNSEVPIFVDAHVPDMLVLPPKLSLPWHELELVKSGKIILQDKSSSFSALALVHGNHKMNEGDYIDACAAPGNKTSHLAALVYDKLSKGKRKTRSKVFCFDRSTARLSILKERMCQLAPLVSDGKKKAQNESKFPIEICPMLQDFLKTDPNDEKFRRVRSILLDPSCSGSGIVNQPDRLADVDRDEDDHRIESLSNFQLVALKHAMSFPNVNRIVYSTCSVHKRENEDVVATALRESNKDIEDIHLKWKLMSPVALKHWKRRGLEHDSLTEEQSNCLIRVDGLKDDTNGFFVSYFERDAITLTESSHEASSLMTTVEGTSGVYSGQFGNTIIEKAGSNLDDGNGLSGRKEEGRSEKEVQIMANQGSNEKKAVPRKKQKKMDWKKKQKARKLERIQKQKASK